MHSRRLAMIAHRTFRSGSLQDAPTQVVEIGVNAAEVEVRHQMQGATQHYHQINIGNGIAVVDEELVPSKACSIKANR